MTTYLMPNYRRRGPTGRWITGQDIRQSISARRTSPVVPPYRLRATDSAFADGKYATIFSAATTHTIFLALDILASEIQSLHHHRVVIYAPAGWEYEAVEQSVSPTDLQAGDTYRTVYSAVQIANTIIQDYAIYGEWRAVVFVDGVERVSLSFTISP